MPFLRIEKPGLLTTVQDLGRWGYQDRGVPVAGPMDLYSHRLANLLVENEPEAATLEATLLGPTIVFESSALFAVTGAEFSPALDGTTVPMNAVTGADAGSCLTFGARHRGARAYLAVAGGLLVTPILGSRSTHLVSRMGGVDGRPLRSGDRLEVGTPSGSPRRRLRDRAPVLTLPEGGARVRVLLGPHHEYFDAVTLARLTSMRYRVSAQSDRMGYRLEGPPLMAARREELISDAMPLGGVQVSQSGQPILLMADHATTGGYPVVATVITADVGVAGQLAPGDWIEFAPCPLEEARAALREREHAIGEV